MKKMIFILYFIVTCSVFSASSNNADKRKIESRIWSANTQKDLTEQNELAIEYNKIYPNNAIFIPDWSQVKNQRQVYKENLQTNLKNAQSQPEYDEILNKIKAFNSLHPNEKIELASISRKFKWRPTSGIYEQPTQQDTEARSRATSISSHRTTTDVKPLVTPLNERKKIKKEMRDAKSEEDLNYWRGVASDYNKIHRDNPITLLTWKKNREYAQNVVEQKL